jgi:hypothetical protein
MITLLLLYTNLVSAAPIREIKVKPNEVATINTAIGYSTVIQFPQKPNNVVLGNLSAFRVEFIKDSITIKPNQSGATSNLFVFTENDRFNFTIRSGPISIVDYVIRIKRTFNDPEKTSEINAYRTQREVRFHLLKLIKKEGSTFIDFSIENLGKKNLNIEPELFRVTSKGSNKTIGSLYLSNDSVQGKELINGSIKIPGTESEKSLAFWLGFRNRTPLSFNFSNFNQAARNANN